MGRIGARASDPLTPAEQEWKFVLEDAFYIICGVAVMALILVSCLSRRVRKRGRREICVPAIGPPRVKTWYGWVDLDKDRKRAQIFKRCSDRVRHLFWWRSAKIDYSWVFWDPNGERQRHYEVERNVGIIGRLPKWMRSYPYRYLQPDALAERGQMSKPRHLSQIKPTSPNSNTVNTDQLDGCFQAESSSKSLGLVPGTVQDEELLESGTVRRRNVGLVHNHAWNAYSLEISEALRTQILIPEEDRVASGFTGPFEDTYSTKAAPYQSPKDSPHYSIPKLRRVFSIPALYASYKDHKIRADSATSDVPLYLLQKNPLLASESLGDADHKSSEDRIGHLDNDSSLHSSKSLPRIKNTDPAISSLSKRPFSWDNTRRSTLDICRSADHQIEDRQSLQDYEAEGSVDGAGSYRDSSQSSMASMYPDIGHHLNDLAAEVYRPLRGIISVPPALSYTDETIHIGRSTKFPSLPSLFTTPQAVEDEIYALSGSTRPSSQQGHLFWFTRLVQRRLSSPDLERGLDVYDEERLRVRLPHRKSMVEFSTAILESFPANTQTQDLEPSFRLVVRRKPKIPNCDASKGPLLMPRKRLSQSKFQHNDITSVFNHYSMDGRVSPTPPTHYINPFAKPLIPTDRLSTAESAQASDLHRRGTSLDTFMPLDQGNPGPLAATLAKRSASVPSSSPPPGLTEWQLQKKSQSIKREYTGASSAERYRRRAGRLSLGTLAKESGVEKEEEGAGSDHDTIGRIEQVEAGSEGNELKKIGKHTSAENKNTADKVSGNEEMAERFAKGGGDEVDGDQS